MFEIIGEHIAELSDEDLRSLIGMLCEAEARRHGHCVSGVTWSGNQNAKDAGLDVRVSLPVTAKIGGFIPKPSTGFQVKKSDMPRGAIIHEMKPKGVIRPAIAALAEDAGAYIIVSAGGSTSDSALADRRAAMAEAMQGVPHAEKLAWDFLDRGRIATWVRDHAGIIPWVRKKIGKAIPGWHPYGAWSHAPDSRNPEYLADEVARIRTGTQTEGDGLSAIDGINRIRDVLRTPGHVVRLVGLSGVGKTRLLEALFEEELGTNALDPALAAYTNVADIPDPQPPVLAMDLLADARRMILVIDNCPPDLHENLSQIVRVPNSTLSIITAEYDIREDQPEGTNVFSLVASSDKLIERLVTRRFPQLSQVDCRTIVESSGGNARIAIALAGTVQKNETIAGLSDAELFRRLFHQRHEPDESLLLIAQVCALFYSFQGHDVDGSDAELPILGGLIGKTADQMYAGVAELLRRDLLQQRSVWRAVLPHAIANRLAPMALKNIPSQRIETTIVKGEPERLLRSFSRRLGYLNSCKEAQAIVSAWLAPSGFLHDVLHLSPLRKAVFQNVALVLPGLTLANLERSVAKRTDSALYTSEDLVDLIHLIAYDPELFERSVALLLRFYTTGVYIDEYAGNKITTLCRPYSSGTHATIEQRRALVEGLLRSPEPKVQALGIKALSSMLTSQKIFASDQFDFGARSRDSGYHPKSQAELATWFNSALKLVEAFSSPASSEYDAIKRIFAERFPLLWGVTDDLCDHLSELSLVFACNGFWEDGWAAIEKVIRHNYSLSLESLAKLDKLEKFLCPKDLVTEVRSTLRQADENRRDHSETIEYDGFDPSRKRTVAALTRLAKGVSSDINTFNELVPELFGEGRHLNVFGHALAKATDSPRIMWEAFISQLTARANGNIAVMCGFLKGLQAVKSDEVEAMLDEAMIDPALASRFAQLQASVNVSDRGIARLYRSLDSGLSEREQFSQLAVAMTADSISTIAFRDFVLAIVKRGRIDEALHLVSMRINLTSLRQPLIEVLELGRRVLAGFQLEPSKHRSSEFFFDLSRVATFCLEGSEGEEVARATLRKLKGASEVSKMDAVLYGGLLRALFVTHTAAALDEVFGADTEAAEAGFRFFGSMVTPIIRLLDGVSPKTLIAWCEPAPDLRYPIIASIGVLFKQEPDLEQRLHWTPLAELLLKNSPGQKAVFQRIVSQLFPASDAGSWSRSQEDRVQLLETLDVSSQPEIHAEKLVALARLKPMIEEARLMKLEQDRRRTARFE
jgi:hypothetical protein